MRSQHLLAGSALAAVIALSAVGAAPAATPEPISPVESADPSAPAELSSPDVPSELSSPSTPAELTPPSTPAELTSPAVPLTPLSPAANPVVVQPDPVAVGAQFSVFDGGNCTGKTGVATFKSVSGGSTIPSVTLSRLSNEVGGVGTIPEGTEPGQYEVSVTCQNGTAKEGPFTGTFTVSSRTPQGSVQTGVGGGIGMDPAETALGAALVAAAVTGTVVLSRRRSRGDSS